MLPITRRAGLAVLGSTEPGEKPSSYNRFLPMEIKDLRCLLYTSPSPRDGLLSRMPSSA